MYAILIGIFVIVAFLLVFVILVQSGKGGGLAGIAGGGMNQLFGGQGSAPFLTRATAILATAFMVIALILGMITRGTEDQTSIMQRAREQRMASPARTLPEVAPSDGAGTLPTE
ncbi:preprotein translocase subunit SecG [candidate division KSB1 bacterium]|nr:preprotein translocase subunit SecG [candidate division KSB1 bacterium]RQW06823.1 MAG: preprotein translocase subunit SecG [candidate division KSB1 bacterium]